MLNELSIRRLLTLALLMTLLVIGHLLMPRYRAVGANLIVPAATDATLWQGATNQLSRIVVERRFRGAVPGLRLTNDDPRRRRVVRHRIGRDEGLQRLLLSGHIRVVGLRPGEKTWMTGRVTIRSLDGTGGVIHGDQMVLASLDGTTAWRHFSCSYAVPASAASIIIMLQQLGPQGSLEVAGLTLLRQDPTAWFPYGQGIWMLLWALWAVLGLRWGFPGGRPGSLVMVALAAAMLTLLLLPVEIVTKSPSALAALLRESGRGERRQTSVAAPLADASGSPVKALCHCGELHVVSTDGGGEQVPRSPWYEPLAHWVERLDVESIGHLGTFAVLGCVLGWVYLRGGIIAGLSPRRIAGAVGYLLGCCLLIATGFELIQRVTTSRNVSLHDWIENSKGLTLGVSLSLVWLHLERRLVRRPRP
jgi:hypothetical protein